MRMCYCSNKKGSRQGREQLKSRGTQSKALTQAGRSMRRSPAGLCVSAGCVPGSDPPSCPCGRCPAISPAAGQRSQCPLPCPPPDRGRAGQWERPGPRPPAERRPAVFQLALASWGPGAPGAAVPTSASRRPACGGAWCSKSPRTAGRPARPWRSAPAACSTRRPRAGPAGTPSVRGLPGRAAVVGDFPSLHPVKAQVQRRESSVSCRDGVGQPAPGR